MLVHYLRNRHREEHDYGDIITISLRDSPKTLPEIEEQFLGFVWRFGFFAQLQARDYDAFAQRLAQELAELMEMGWLVRQGEQYVLTPLGLEMAAEARSERKKLMCLEAWGRKLIQPQTASQLSLGVHLALAALKLSAGLLSGSVGLLNDALDTLLDGLSSVLVYIGFRFDRERAVNVVLALMMLSASGLTLYGAVQRFVAPVEPKVNWFTLLAAILSALVCLALGVYQRFVGLHSGSMVLTTQSQDARNHVIVAVSVTIGLVASLLRFALLDTLVGLAVALLILKTTVEMAVEVVRSLREEKAELPRYPMGSIERYIQSRQAQLHDWMLYLVERQGGLIRTELIAQANQALDFSDNLMLRELGLARQPQAGEMIRQGLAELFERGWLEGEERVSITDAGREYLRRQMREQEHRLVG